MSFSSLEYIIGFLFGSGVLLTIFRVFYRMGVYTEKIGSLEKEFHEFKAETTQRFNKIEDKFDIRMNKLESKMDQIAKNDNLI